MYFNYNDQICLIKKLNEMDLDNPYHFCHIPDFEKYVINGHGDVWSLHRNNFIIPVLNTSDFKTIKMHKDKIPKTIILHKLVATLFIPNPDNYPYVTFIDDNKNNVAHHNLKWIETKKTGTVNKRRYACSRKTFKKIY